MCTCASLASLVLSSGWGCREGGGRGSIGSIWIVHAARQTWSPGRPHCWFFPSLARCLPGWAVCGTVVMVPYRSLRILNIRI